MIYIFYLSILHSSYTFCISQIVIIFILRKIKIITTELALILLIVLLALDISPVLVIMFVCWAVTLHLPQMDVKHLQYPE